MNRPDNPWIHQFVFATLVVTLVLLSGCETESPTLLEASILQDTSDTTGPYQVMAQVIGDPETTVVELRYHREGDTEVTVSMEHYDGLVWAANIPGQPTGSRILYFVAVADVDELENPQTLPEAAPTSQYAFRIVSP